MDRGPRPPRQPICERPALLLGRAFAELLVNAAAYPTIQRTESVTDAAREFQARAGA